MTHLRPEEMVEAAEGTLALARRAHLDVCGECRQEVAHMTAMLSRVRDDEVPEPSPLFWSHLSARVRSAVGNEAVHERESPRWLRWPMIAPLGALALLAIGVLTSVPQREPAPPIPVEVGAITIDDGSDATGWNIVADLVGDLDLEAAAAAGVQLQPGVTEEMASTLTLDEQQTLTRLLQEELQRPRS